MASPWFDQQDKERHDPRNQDSLDDETRGEVASHNRRPASHCLQGIGSRDCSTCNQVTAMIDPTEARTRHFLRHCKVCTLKQPVHHGTPLTGLIDMLVDGELHPQGHAELPSYEYLSVSINDNVLNLFADDDHLTGFSAYPTDLQVVRLTEAYRSLFFSYNIGAITKDAELIRDRWYYDQTWEHESSADNEVRRLLKAANVESMALGGRWEQWAEEFFTSSWNEEAEIALTKEGCDKVWKSIDTIYIRGQEYEAKDGWKEVLRIGKKDGLIDHRTASRIGNWIRMLGKEKAA